MLAGALALAAVVWPAAGRAQSAAPEITSATEIAVDEAMVPVATLTASDDDTPIDQLTWTIPSGTDGGADASSFTLSQAGVLDFTAAKDYETPDDADTDRTYEVTVEVSDGTDSDMAELLVTLLNVTELTAITGPESVEFPENSWSRVATFTASSEEDRAGIEWILGGTDSDHFSIDNPPGALRFALDAVAPRIFSEPPDFEAPVDPDAANTYELTLLAKAGSSVTDASFTVTVTVTDVDEEGALSLSSTRPALGAALRAVPSDPDGVTAGTALWQWERSTGRNSWAVIDGAAAESYTPVAADTNTFLRVTATYEDKHGTGKTVSEVAPNVVTGPLLTGLTAETEDSRAETARGLYPAFDPQTLHYGIGCNNNDTLVLTVSAPANARVAVDGVQAASAPEEVSVAVWRDSDVAIRVTDANGAATTYIVHCLRDVFFAIETHTFPNTEAFEDLILFNRAGYFRLMDRNGVPRLRLGFEDASTFAARFHRIGVDGAYRYGFNPDLQDPSFIVLDEDFEVVEDNVSTVGSSLTPINPHDFQILENGNYLLTANPTVTGDFRDFDLPPPADEGVDLSSVRVWDQTLQIVTPGPGAQAVFTWGSWGNIAVEDCVQHRFPVTLSTDPEERGARADISHFNGAHMVDGVIAASLRGCSKVLGIDVATGDVVWRMGRTNLSDAEWSARDIGPRPLDFINDPEGEFCGQHTARFLPNGNIFLFDNGVVCAIDPWTFEELGREGSDFSRAVEYALDFENHEAVFVRDHSLRGERSHIGYANGNVDVLDNGDWLVSWGRPLDENVTIPDNEVATLVDPATGQEKLGIRFRELPSSARGRRINATVAPAEALAPQPEPLIAGFPASDHTSLVHTGSGDAPQVIVAFNQPVVDFDETTPSLNVTGATVASVSAHIVAGESANAYVVTLTPAGASDIIVRLVADQPCADGGICTAGETLLPEVPSSHVIRADTTPPTVSKIEISSNSGTDRTYAAGDEIQATVTFSETVFVTGTPQLTLELGGGQRTGTYEGGSGTAALVFGYTVAVGESDTDGVGVEADSLSGGTIRDGAGHNAVLDHEAVAPQAGHQVDGVRPAFVSAAVDGASLTLTYGEALDGGSRPAPGDFTVQVDGTGRSVSGVSVNDAVVTLTLNPEVEHGDTGIRVSYTPGTNPLRDEVGNDALGLSSRSVTNTTDAPNTAPQITSPSSFDVPENQAMVPVATLTASDDDTPIDQLTWTIPSGTDGGADASSFTLSQAGVLDFTAAKDYETPDDADTDRTYEVSVEVSDGTDSDMAELLVTLLNVTELTAITGPESVTFPENSWSRVATFTASSEEDRAGIEWILGGTDSDHFSIDSPPGALRFALDAVAPRIFSEPPDFEAPVDGDAANTYELTLLAKAGSSVTDASFTVTVTVTDVDEEGALSLSSTRPALGAALRAVLSDPDGVTAGTALWQWERSTGRNSWAVIDGAAAESYTPVAADTNTFLRVTATYEDEHGTGKTVSEVAPNVVTGLLLTGLTAETDDSRAETARGLYPAFDPQTLHYGIGCNSTDTLVLTVSAPANARVAVAGVQAASAPMAVDVSEDSDVAIRLTDASGAGTTYVVHCLPEVFFDIETHTFPNTEAFEDLILLNRANDFTLMDRNGVPRLRRAYPDLSPFAMRFHRIGAHGGYRYAFFFGIGEGYTILDEDFEVVAEGVWTVSPLTHFNNHDFQILEDGNYLVMSHEPAMRDFSDIDLPYLDGADVSSVNVRDSAFQIVTPGGHAVFTWKSWGNMAIEDCVQHRFPLTLSTDPDMRSPNGGYAHINGMHLVDGVLVASMRGCSKVLGIDVSPGATRGDVLWRMGRTNLSDAEWSARDIGPRPLDFINDPEGEFCGQHTARFLPNGNIFLFDNGVVCAIDPWTFEELGREGSDFSRAVEYALDLENHEAVFVRDHSLRGERDHLGYATGNVDALDNGDWLVSWGRPLDENVTIPDNEVATLVDPATGQEKLGLRFRELPSSERGRRINATVAPAEALAPQPEPLIAGFPASDHTSLVHTGSGDAPQVIVAFNQPVVDFDETTPSLSVTGATVASVSAHIVAGESANAYVVTLTPAGASDITVRLVADQPCADGGICTAGETLLPEVPASHVIRGDTTPPTVSKIEISSNSGTDRTYAAGDEIQATVTFSETVFVTGTPQLTLELGGGQRTGTYEGGSGTAALVFGYTVAVGESDTDGVGVEADSLSGGTIRDGAGHNAVLDHQAVAANASHKVDGVKPALAASGGAVVNGTTLTLTYDEALDGSSTPVPGDFTVSGGDRARTVTGVRVNGSGVELTLDAGAEHGEAGIQVSYTPGVNPIQDVPGNVAEALSREPVTNETPDTTSPEVSSLAITSSPGSDETYAAGEEIEVEVRFSETVEVTGTPQLRLRVGTRNRTAGYDSGTGTAALVFAYEVADGDEDTGGVSIEAGRIALNGGMIEDEADNDAVLDHEAVTPQAGHKVDGVKPQLAATGGEVVNGTTLTLTYDEALDGSSTPATGDFTVSGGDRARTVTGVRVNGSAVELTLDVGAEHGEAGIQVSYTPGVNPIQDVPGNAAEALSREPVTNETPDTTSPEVSSLAITSSPGSDETYAAGEEIEVEVRFSETVEVTGTPQLRLRVGTRNRTAGYDSGTGTAALVFAYEVADGDEDTGGVSIEAGRIALNGGMIEDEADNDAVLDHEAVTPQAGHKVDGVKPQLAATGGEVVNGTTLTLTYDEALDGSSTPATGDFTVSGGDRARTVTGVRVNGSAVELTLDVGAEHGEAGIQVSYTPGVNPIQDVPGNAAEALSREPVTNETPDTTSPTVSSLAITSSPGSDETYAAGEEIEVEVRFSETVEVTGTPQLRLKVGTRNRTAGYDSGTGTAALVFAYEVADGDEDTGGVSIEAGRITLNGGMIEDEADNDAVLDHEAVTPQAGHKVDGVRPAFVSAAVDGASLTLTYGEALDGGSRPAPGDFTVQVDGTGRSVSGVSISDAVVTLTLNPEVEHGDTGIRVSYTPGTNPLRDEVGNDALGLSSRSVTNTTDAPNTAPQITSPSSFDVPENQAMVRRLAARDTDPGDEVTGWEIVGGAAQGRFTITSDTGDLSFRTAPDFEAPGDNEYEVTVEVKSGAGARELEAEKTFTISVTDEREPPEVPEAPTFSGETADSLTVNWSEPDNTGPAITDYDVQYREKGTGGFIDGQHAGPGLSLTLDDLEPGTVYEVQVRATNDEGRSDWSESGEGMTVTPLTVEMASDLPPPVEGPFTVRFSFSETVRGFSSSDIETQQEPACTDSTNNPVFCNPSFAAFETTDDRIFTTTVTPQTDRVAHSYTLTLTVPGGAVRSSVGNKPNEEPEEPLEVRVSPPGVPEPISSMGLTASGGNGTVRLSWNLPSDNGGSPIMRYEYRYQAVGEEWSEWENLGPGVVGVTVENLINGNEYVCEVRAVNALGKGGTETVQATPERRIAPPPPPPPPGNGGGGGLLFPPEAPASLMAMAGDGAVRLEWSPPESDGGTPILRYEYRLKEGRGAFGEWTPIEDSAPDEVNATGYTVGELGNGTVYVFEVRAVNLVGNGRESEAVEAVMRLDRAYGSNFLAEDLQGSEAGLEWAPFGGTPRSLKLRFGAGLRFEEDELDGEGEVTATRMGSYGYRYTSQTTGELRLDYDGEESCELRLTFRGEGAGSYSYRCGGALQGQGSFRLTGLNRVPEITGAGLFEVVENQAMVGRLEAVDPDEGDGIAGYGIAGGADGALFAVVEETGELLFREAPDYETPGDVASDDPQSGAADNEYIVVVEVRSGEGERERKGSRAIRVRVADEEEPPEITSVGPFEVVENRTRVGQLEAVDQDKQDEITEYGIAGGADGGLFEVVEETGELMFREAPDYETPGDEESAEPASGAADNEYIVVVEVRSGEGERERKGSRAIRVRVSDEEEPPEAPAAPVVTAEGSDSLKASWREPENQGPEITDYEVRYRESGEAGYSDGGHEGTGLEVRLSGLEEGTVYEVQVRAVNEEGISEWSEPGEGRTDSEEPDPDDPSDFTGEDLEGRRLTLRNTGKEGAAGSLELRFGEGNRFEQIESVGEQAATRTEGASRSGSYSYQRTGSRMGTLSLAYDDGSSCEVLLAFTESGAGTFSYDCGGGDPAEGSFRLTTGSLFVPVILSSAGQNQSFFTSELTLTNRGDGEVKLDYTYTAHRGGGSGKTSDVLAPGMQKIETDALTYLRGLGVPIPETGNRIGTLRVEARLGSEVEAVVRTTTVVAEGRAGLAYLGVAEEEGFTEAVYLCGLRQNSRDRSNVAFQNMGAPEEGAITISTTVYSGEAADATARVLEEVTLEPGEFHQYSGLLGVLGVPAHGYVKVERVEGRASFYAYGVINDQANSDGSFVFPVTASSLEGKPGQTLPVIVETSAFTSELTVTNFSGEVRTLDFQFVADGIEAAGNAAGFRMRLEPGQQEIVADVVEELRRQGVAGLGSTRGFYAGPLFAVAESGDMSGIVIGARTGSQGGGGSYSVFYNAVPEGGAFTKEAWVDGLQQNEENRSNLALVNTGEVDGSASVFHLEIYDGETGLLEETVVTKPIPARRWHQINGILGSYAPETRQGYIRIEKVSGENPFLAYGVVNDGGAPGERSGDGAYLPARE